MKLKMNDKDNCDFLTINSQTVSFSQHWLASTVKAGLASQNTVHKQIKKRLYCLIIKTVLGLGLVGIF